MKLKTKIIIAVVFGWLGLNSAVAVTSKAAEKSIYTDTIADEDLLNGSRSDVVSQIVQDMVRYTLENPSLTSGNNRFILKQYDFISGKVNLKYSVRGAEHSILIQHAFIKTSFPTDIETIYKNPEDGLSYIPNCEYVSIYRDDGYYKRYYIANSDSPFTLSVGTTQTSISHNRNSVAYDVSDGSDYGTIAFSNIFPSVTSFTNRNVNSIVCTPSDFCQWINTDNEFIAWYDDVNISDYQIYPTDKQILTNSYKCFRFYNLPSDSTTRTNAFQVPFYTSWYDTNNKQNAISYSQQITNYNNKNYYYNNRYDSSTIINNNNKNDIFNGVLSPSFNPDGTINVPIDPDLYLPDLKPVLDGFELSLENAIKKFYVDMPDLNLPFDTGGNNYFDIEFPPSDPGGGGGGTVWQPPKYDKLTTTPIITTRSNVELVEVTFPTSVLSNGGKILESGLDGLTDCMPELVSVALVCMVFGFLWKFTGG